MQTKTEVANGKVVRITNRSLHEAQCRNCSWGNCTRHAASAAKRHVEATGHEVRSVVSKVTLYVRKRVQDGAGDTLA